jgi:hypothetical protein
MKKIKVDKESCELLQSIAIRHRLQTFQKSSWPE